MVHTMHFKWVRKHPKFPLPLGLRHPTGGGPSHSDRRHAQKIGKDCACGSGDMLMDRQTETHRRAHYDTLPPLLCAK